MGLVGWLVLAGELLGVGAVRSIWAGSSAVLAIHSVRTQRPTFALTSAPATTTPHRPLPLTRLPRPPARPNRQHADRPSTSGAAPPGRNRGRRTTTDTAARPRLVRAGPVASQRTLVHTEGTPSVASVAEFRPAVTGGPLSFTGLATTLPVG